MRAVLYCRISKDAEERGLGVARQEKDCRAICANRGWEVAAVYVDNDVSAARKKGRLPERPNYDQMLADIKAGVHGPAGDLAVVSVESERLHREPFEAEKFYLFGEAVGLGRMVTPLDNIDLGTGDLLVARIRAAVAADEIRKIRRRVKSKHEELAVAGLPSGGGKRPYGYQAGGLELEPVESENLRQAAARILAGESLDTVAPDVGLRASSLSRVLRSPRIVGVRVHGGERYPAQWPAILDADTQARVVRRLRVANKGNGRRRHGMLLSGLLECGRCGSALRSQGAGLYACKRSEGVGCGRCAIRAEVAEPHILETFLGFLSDPEMARRRATPADNGFDADAILGALEEDRGLLVDLAGMLARREIGKDEWAAARGEIQQRIDAAEAALRAGGAVEGRPEPADVLREWETATPERRRLWIGAYLEAVVVLPVGRGSRVSVEDRIPPGSFRWRA